MKPNTRRLLKLAKHLRGKNRGHDMFDFGTISWENRCGTAGCAIGELPFVFPNAFYLNVGIVFMRGNKLFNFEAAQAFFRLTTLESHHLFLPDAQDTKRYGGKELGRRATASQVAANIEAFVEKMR
jgi:hypothetical protein